MKHFFSFAALFMLLLFTAQTHAQDVLGCTAIYADNYNPEATINDGTCNYDLPQLLGDGYCIGELLNGGVLWQDFRGVSYQGGVIVHIDEDLGKALVCDEEDYSEGGVSLWKWGCLGNPVDGMSCGLYQGLSNTQNIVTAGCLDEPSAAIVAYQAIKDGYVDWFLPTATEFYAAVNAPGWSSGLTSGSDYWTSTDYDAYYNSTYGSEYYAFEWDFGETQCSQMGVRTLVNRVRLMRYVNIDQNCLEQGVCGDWQYDGEQLQPETAGVSCSYELFSCANTGDPVWNSIILGVYPASTSEIQYGLTWDRDILLNVPNFYEYQGNMYDVVGFDVNGVSGVPEGLTIDIASGDQVVYNDQACLGLSGDVLQEGSYTLEISGTLLLSILGAPFSIEDIVLTHQIEVTPNTDGIPGCIYDFAGNFNPIATYDDGSCVAGSQGPCPGDLDGDQLIGVGDILSLLSLFNSSCN